MPSADPNEHIRKSLDIYLKSTTIQQAIMLTGSWGSGKTHFIKDYIKQREEVEKTEKTGHNKKPIAYLSLFGASSVESIQSKLLISNDKLVGYGSKTLNGISRFISTKLGANLDDVPGNELEISAEKLFSIMKLEERFSEWVVEDQVIVFDDLERIKMEPTRLLGYLNNLLEHKNCKIILISNEEQLERKEDNNDYFKMVEKVVFQRFKIAPCLDDYIDTLISSYETEHNDYALFLRNNTETIKNNFSFIGGNNFRSTHKAIYQFCRLFELIKQHEVKRREEALIMLFSFFCTLSFSRFSNEDLTKICLAEEHKQIPWEDVIISTREKNKNSALAEAIEEITESDEADVRISKAQKQIFSGPNANQFNYIYKDLLPRQVWKELILDEIFDEKKITISLLNSRFMIDYKDPSYLQLRGFEKLSPDVFTEQHQGLMDEITRAGFKSLGEIMEVLITLHHIENNGLIDPVSSEVLLQLKKQVSTLTKIEFEHPVHSYAKYMSGNLKPFSLDKYNTLYSFIIKHMTAIDEKGSSNFHEARYTSLRKGEMNNLFGNDPVAPQFLNKSFDRQFGNYFRSMPAEIIIEDLASCLESSNLDWSGDEVLEVLQMVFEPADANTNATGYSSHSDQNEKHSEWLDSLIIAQENFTSKETNCTKLTIYRLNLLLKRAKKYFVRAAN